MAWNRVQSGWTPVAVTGGDRFRLSDGERTLRFESAQTEEKREPVKFEAGQVVRVKFPEQPTALDVLVRAIGDDFVYGCVADRSGRGTSFTASVYERSAEILSPAPRAGDTWTSGESAARIEADGDGRCGSTNLRIVSEGEPFVDAIRAALVGASEQTNLTPFEIAACIAALRHWEARRPFERDLAALQRRNGVPYRDGPWHRLQCDCRDLLTRTLGYQPVWNFDGIFFLYERARSPR